MKQPKITTTFASFYRLTQKAKDRIEEIHEETGLSRSKVVERKMLDLPVAMKEKNV